LIQLPYPSMPFARTRPGTWLRFRGNIIPLAARFPKAHFAGVDLSAQHIRVGSRRIATLGLKNIELQRGDLAETEFGPDAFDYVICRGVFSWVLPRSPGPVFRGLWSPIHRHANAGAAGEAKATPWCLIGYFGPPIFSTPGRDQ
jgi:hypothetical protein